MASGIAVGDKCIAAYNALNKRASSIVVMKMNAEMTSVEVEKTIPAIAGSNFESEWKSFYKTLPENDCRYVIVDFQWNDTPTVTKSKVIAILFSGDYSPVRSKMVYASSFTPILNSMPVQRSIQASDYDDLEYKAVKDSVCK
jgi:cofilin